jgi:hypothetical protein
MVAVDAMVAVDDRRGAVAARERRRVRCAWVMGIAPATQG